MTEIMEGYGTYVIGSLLILGAIGLYLVGDESTAAMLVGLALSTMGLRRGMKKLEK